MQQGHTQPKQTPAPFGKQSTADRKLSVIRQSSNLVLTERIIFGPGVTGEADFISWKTFPSSLSAPQILHSYLTQLLVGIKFSQQITANHLSPWEAIPCNCQGRVRHFIPALCQMAKKLHSAAPRLTSCSPESPVTTVDFIRRKPPWPTLNSIDSGEAHPWPPKLHYQSPTAPLPTPDYATQWKYRQTPHSCSLPVFLEVLHRVAPSTVLINWSSLS